jgi:hypothetical protein
MTQALLEERYETLRFSGTLEASGKGESTIALPAGEVLDISSEQVAVEGVLDGFPFRGILVRGEMTEIRISEAVQNAAGAQIGDSVRVEITRIGDELEIRIPADLSEALSEAPAAQALFEEVTPMARREWIRWVASAKQEETRAGRIVKGIDMLHHGKKRPCCFPGVNWVTKDLVSPEETWIPLPSSRNGSGK